MLAVIQSIVVDTLAGNSLGVETSHVVNSSRVTGIIELPRWFDSDKLASRFPQNTVEIRPLRPNKFQAVFFPEIVEAVDNSFQVHLVRFKNFFSRVTL
jgi:hypothetical protein